MAAPTSQSIKCPVCGSAKVTQRYKDGVESYHCDKGHVFIVEKK
jgi:RNA polymerase subunit RPABC4/transcription elongation factor Spt4